MIWEFSIFALTLIYGAVLWFAYTNPVNFIWPGIIFLLFLLVAVKWISKKYVYFVLPALLFIGSVLLLPLIAAPLQARIFLVLSAGVFYLATLGSYRLRLYDKDKTAKAMYNLTVLVILFTWFTSAYGWYLNIEIPIWILMITFALATFLVSFVAIRINQLSLNRHQRFLYAVFLAYLIAGTIWVQNFWPFGYLTTGVITLIIYYSAWDLISSYFQDKLSIRRLSFNLLFMVGSAGAILLSARWYPVM